MNRLCRWLFSGLAGTSLLLCIVMMAIWVQSYKSGHGASIYCWGYSLGLSIGSGVVSGYLQHDFGQPPSPVSIFTSHWGYTGRPRRTGSMIRLSKPPIFGIRHFELSDRYGDPPPPDHVLATSLYGFQLNHAGSSYAGRIVNTWYNFAVPFWPFVCLLALLPAVWFRRITRRSKRRRSGYCSECGYDLRATPDRCPECGKAVEQAI